MRPCSCCCLPLATQRQDQRDRKGRKERRARTLILPGHGNGTQTATGTQNGPDRIRRDEIRTQDVPQGSIATKTLILENRFASGTNGLTGRGTACDAKASGLKT